MTAWVRFCKALRNFCSQCGQRFDQRACGPTHAAIAAARRESVRRTDTDAEGNNAKG